MEKSTKSGINILFDNQSNINLLNNSRDKMIEIFVKLSKGITFNVHFLRKRKSLLMKINNNSGRTNYEEREKGSRDPQQSVIESMHHYPGEAFVVAEEERRSGSCN